MSYADIRDSEQLRFLDVAIAQFIQRYTSNPSTGRRRTLFLFPGGMGCQLLRATKPYRDNVAGPQTFQYDKVWLMPMTFVRDALTPQSATEARPVPEEARHPAPGRGGARSRTARRRGGCRAVSEARPAASQAEVAARTGPAATKQRWATDGIASMTRPGVVARSVYDGGRVRRAAEPAMR